MDVFVLAEAALEVPGWLAAIIGAVGIASAPWAISVERRVAKIQTSIEHIEQYMSTTQIPPPPWFKKEVEDLEDRVKKAEERIRKIELKCNSRGETE
jgi:hypothetical protein